MSPELLEQIAEQVHIGWMQEKQRQGFADHPLNEFGQCYRRDCDKPYGEHHPDMLPYGDLADHVKAYDRVTVCAVFAGIEKAGYRVVKAEEAVS